MDDKILLPKKEFEQLKEAFDRFSEERKLRKQAEEKLKTANGKLEEQLQAEEQLHLLIESQEAILNNAAYMVISTDCEGNITTFNPAAERALGYTTAECIGKQTPVIFHDAGELAERAAIFTAELGIPVEPGFEVFAAKARLKLPNEYEWMYIRKNGSRFPVLLSVTALYGREGSIMGFLGIANDITESKLAAEAQRRLNRELRAISNCNQVLMRADDEQTLLNDICQIICDEAGYRMAWVGYAEHDQEMSVRAVAHAGIENGYLESANILWANAERGRGPSGVAIRTGESACIQDFTIEPQAAPWRESAMERGYRSSIALPLKDENANVFGVLNIYSTEPNAFNPDEIRLLEDLAGDLAFGIAILRTRTERKQAEELIRKREAEFRTLAENIPDHIIRYDINCRAIYINHQQEENEYSVSSLIGTIPMDHEFAGPVEIKKYQTKLQRVIATGVPEEMEVSLPELSGINKVFEVHILAERNDRGEIIGAMSIRRDITEQKEAEADLRSSEERYRMVFENSPVSIWEEDFSGVKAFFDNLKKDGVTDIEAYFDQHPETIRKCADLAKIIDVNRAALALHEASNKEELIAGLADTFTPESFDAFRKELICLWNEQKEMTIETVVKTLAGERRYVTVYFSVCPGYGESLSKVLVSLADNTESKRNEAVNASRLHLMQFARTHSLPELFKETLDEAEKLTDSRIGFYHFVDDDQNTLTLQDWSTRTKAEFCNAEGNGLHYAITDAGVWVDCVYQRKPVIHNDYASLPNRKGMPEGHASVIRELVVPVFRGEKIKAILGIGNKPTDYVEKDAETVSLLVDLAWEIAERKLAEEALSESEERFRLAFEFAGIGMALLSPEGRWLRINQVICQMLGYTAEELKQTTFQALTHPEDLSKNLGEAHRLLAGEIPCMQAEKRYRHKDGSYVWTHLNTSIVRSADGKPMYYISQIEDITERKQAEAALRESEEKYRTLIQKIQTAVIVHSADTKIITCNVKAQELLGLTEDQLLGKTSIDPTWHFFREDGMIMPLEEYPVNRVMATRQALRNYIVGVHRPDNENDVWALVNADPVFDRNDQITQVIITFSDITERKLSESMLEKTTRRLNEAQHIGHIGSWELDLVHNILNWSDEIFRIFEIDKSKFGASYEAFLSAIHPDDRDAVNNAYNNSLKTRIPYTIDHRLLFSDGRIKWVHEQCESYYNADGKPTRSIGIVQDITERKRMEDALFFVAQHGWQDHLENFFDALARFLGEKLDMDYVFIDKIGENPDMAETVALYAKGKILPNMRYVLKGTPCEKVIGRQLCIYPNGIQQLFPEDTLLSELGAESYIGIPLWDSTGRSIGLIAVVGNKPLLDEDSVTQLLQLVAIRAAAEMERKQAEEEIRKLNQELEQRVIMRTTQLEAANKELESFAYSVSHDLRAPLRSIDGFSQILLDECREQIDEQGKDYLNRVRFATQRMAQLIDDMLNLSRVSRGEMNIQEVNLSQMVQEITGELRGNQPERQVEFIIGGGIKAHADSRLLRIVLENLIGNAWKFTSKHPAARIEFGVQKHNEKPIYFISDDGAGFDMNYAQKLFGAFQRLHTSTEFPGTGVGLATVQRVIHRHGGKVWAEGEVEKGATFYFTI